MNYKLLIYFCMFIIFFIPFSFATLTTDISRHYTLNEITNQYLDSVNNINISTITMNRGVGGILDKATQIDNVTSYMDIPNTNINFGSTNKFTINLWLNKSENPPSNTGTIFTNCPASNEFYLGIRHTTAGGVYPFVSKKGVCSIGSATTIPNNEYFMITMVFNTTHLLYYLNGTLQATDSYTCGSAIAPTSAWTVGKDECTTDATRHANRAIDELTIWNRTLSQTEIDQLYNSGSGLEYPFTGAAGYPPTITLSTNLTSYTNNTLNPFTFSIDAIGQVINTTDLWNISLYLNNTLNQTHLNIPLNESKYIINLTYGNEQIGYNVNVSVFHGYDDAKDDFQRLDIFLDSVPPDLSITSTIENNTILYHNMDSDKNYTIFCTDANLFACNVTLYQLNDSGSRIYKWNNTFFDNINDTTFNITQIFNINYLNNSRYEIYAQAWDSHTANPPIKEVQWYFQDNNLITSDNIIFQGNIKETTPKGDPATYFYLSDELDRYKFKVTFEQDSLIHYLNISTSGNLVYRPNDGYMGHFVYLDANRWIDFEGANVKNVQVTDLGNNKFGLEIEHYTITDEVEFNSIGDLNSLNSSWYFNVSDGYTFYAQDGITSNAISNFTVNIINGTTLLQSKSTTNGNITFNITSGNFTTNITASGYANNKTSLLTFSLGGSFTYNLFAENSLYLFFYDEETDLLISNITILTDVIGGGSAASYNTTTGSIFISGFNTGDYEILYSGSGYRTRSYFTSITDSSTQTIDLYLVQNVTSSLIVFTLADEKGNPIQNATLKALRFFINDNAYLVVNMEKSDANGEAGMYLIPNDVYYQFIVEKDGSILNTFSPQKIFSADVVLPMNTLEEILTSWNAINQDISTSFSWNNNTNIISYTWNDNSGIVTQGCIKLTKRTRFGDTVLANNCVNVSIASMSLNATSYIDNSTFYAEGYLKTNTRYSEPITDLIIKNFVNDYKTFDRFGLFIGYILIGTLFMVGIYFSFTIAVVYSTIAMVALQMFGVTYFGISFISIVLIVGLAIAVVNRI